ncbi:protein-disulfide reductase DsbD family protein [Pseudoxanthomonas sp. UTMC 1351]|uniref:protein-disulfide reductase DsbD family protein n=1 Tax=Pseudoxanthomonas sp. UTMC 1351 TaxID=2695853 RepID=UPI0034CE4BF5
MSAFSALLLILASAWPSAPALAVDVDDLLPVDQAFELSAKASTRDRIEVEWKIADGYYLYRHRTDVQATEGFTGEALQLPKGKAYRDEFFGDVETYRDRLTGILPGTATADRVTLKVKYQGCADAGVCYPPQTRTLTVTLPAAGSAPAAFVPLTRPGTSLLGNPAASAIDAAPLSPEQAFAFEAIAFNGDQLLLRFTPTPGYYVYRDRTSMTLEGAPGIALQPPQWPTGKAYHDEHFGDVVVYFDQAEVPVPLKREHVRAADATLRVTFQGCQTGGICYPPMTRQVKLSLPAGTITPTAAVTGSATSADAAVASEPDNAEVAVTPGATAADTAAASTPAEVPRTTPPADVQRRNAATVGSFLLALLLALGGGIILNLMPCVLPVLSLKALSLADSGRSGGRARQSALWYTAGVLISFVAIGALALGLRAAGQALGWGFQLQQPWVVGLLAYLMFAIGLSLSGVFSVGHRLAGAGDALTRQSGPAGDFFTGVLAVVIASPCTAPFMGAALAFAFTASTPLALMVFAALGLGLALPFLLIGFVPALANRLPRPGAWMETLKQFLAFPMYLTAVWLLWVLGNQRGIDAIGLALAGLVLLALGLWWFQRLRLRTAPLRRGLAVLLAAASLVPLAMAHRLPSAPRAGANASAIVPFSNATLTALRAEGRVVFVDMTADWCVTCKANEKTVLHTQAFRDLLEQHNAVFVQGDWTNVDPEITAFLESHKAVGVPLYVVYPRNGGEGEVLPTVLTRKIVSDAMARAAQ